VNHFTNEHFTNTKATQGGVLASFNGIQNPDRIRGRDTYGLSIPPEAPLLKKGGTKDSNTCNAGDEDCKVGEVGDGGGDQPKPEAPLLKKGGTKDSNTCNAGDEDGKVGEVGDGGGDQPKQTIHQALRLGIPAVHIPLATLRAFVQNGENALQTDIEAWAKDKDIPNIPKLLGKLNESRAHLERLLSDTDFQDAFNGMLLLDFVRLPRWKQQDLKKKAGLF